MIIADEPTGNIDPALSFEIVDLLSEINRRGTTVLRVTHEHSLVKHFHKRIIQIHSGEIVADTAAMREESAKAPAADSGEFDAVDDYAEGEEGYNPVEVSEEEFSQTAVMPEPYVDEEDDAEEIAQEILRNRRDSVADSMQNGNEEVRR